MTTSRRAERVARWLGAGAALAAATYAVCIGVAWAGTAGPRRRRRTKPIR